MLDAAAENQKLRLKVDNLKRRNQDIEDLLGVWEKKAAEVERLIRALLLDAYTIPEKQRPGPNNADYAEAYGIMRGFLVAVYGKFDQSMTIRLADNSFVSANDWFRGIKESVEKEVGIP